MNKNPFAVPQAAYTPAQPPLPPGPPPPQPAQPDYSAYWAAAAAAQGQQPATQAYNPQWSVPQPAQPPVTRPPPEQSALYANYGYGNQWQHQQRQQQQQQHFQPPPPVVQPPPPPPQPAYNPYQPQAGTYQQPYIPQAPAPHAVQPQVPYTPQAPSVQPFQQQHPPAFFPQQQQNRNNNRNLHQSPSQHLPPAKRQRFDGPNRPPIPSAPQFQAPPPPMQQPPTGPIGGGVGVGVNASNQNFGPGRGGAPGVNQMPLGPGRGGFGGNRGGGGGGGGGMGGGRGRGGSMNMGRGGNRGGRGGGMYNNTGGRGGSGGSFRGNNRNFGNRDNRRGGGSFNSGSGQNFSHGHQQQQQSQQQSHHNQQGFGGGSFRGRNQGYANNSARGGRHDSGAPHGPKESSTSAGTSSGKKDENRRTLTDFKIIGLEIQELAWSWGTVPKPSVASEDVHESQPPQPATSMDTESEDVKPIIDSTTGSTDAPEDAPAPPPAPASSSSTSTDPVTVKTENGHVLPPPPSRIRIYFHTPVSADDAHPLSSQSSLSHTSFDPSVRKGKRKKLEDDDGDLEDGRGPPPPPPQHSGFESEESTVVSRAEVEGSESGMGRGSVAPSVAETASEGDWLMASLGEEEGADGSSANAHALEGDNVHDADADGEPDDFDGNDYDEVDAQMGMGDEPSPMHGDDHIGDNGPSDDNSVPPGLNGHDALPEHSAVTGPNDDNDAHMASAPPEEHDHASPPASTDAEAPASAEPIPADSDAAPPAVEAAPQPADDADGGSSTQASSQDTIRPTESIATIAEANGHEEHPQQPATQAEDGDEEVPLPHGLVMEPTQVLEPSNESAESEHPPPSETSSTTLDASPVHPIGPSEMPPQAVKPETDGNHVPSANRLSISYAAGTRRMVIDSAIVEKLKVFRSDARIEVHMTINEEAGNLKGILLEGTSDSSLSYTVLDIPENPEDQTVPPFRQGSLPLKAVLVAYLDKDRPLSEPRWVKTGDVQDWLKSMFGRMFWVAGDEAADGWEKKIEVVDPDPPPTIWTVLEAWAVNSNVGQNNERQRFLRTHMTETDNILEILLRLVRGERASYSQSAPVISAPSVSGPLLTALSQGSAHGAQQTHVSLAVLAIFRLAVEFAKKADGEGGRAVVEERVGEIIRCLPSHLIYKSLDGIFKEWRVEKKGGGR